MKRIRRTLFGGVKDESMSFHKSIAFAIVLGQMFGIMPLHGVTAPSTSVLRFKWKSWKVIYSVTISCGTLFCVYASLTAALQQNNNLSLITASIFYGSSFVVHLLFIVLARNWSQLMREWHAVDVGMQSYGYPPQLNKHLRFFATALLLGGTAEHIMVVISNILQASSCRNDEFFEHFFARISFPQAFAIVGYSIWAGFALQIVTTFSTFSWNFVDLFIILLSIALASRFKQVTERVKSYLVEEVSDVVLWRTVREDYSRLSKLCKALNKSISCIVFISFGSNLFFILVQFFFSLRPMRDTLSKVYFFYSFGFLIGRTVCVSLYGSRIHDESQKPLPLLNSVSSTMYNLEIKRFILHAGIETISLNGKRFFNVTRSIILSIAGTIVTYELVLIQFYGSHIQTSLEENSSCSA